MINYEQKLDYLEDIIEELIGEIYDEHDAAELQDIVQQQDGTYRVLCGTNVDKMFDYFDVEEEVDATTVNGWVVLQIDKLPSVGDKFTYVADYKQFDVVVTKADERKSLEINMVVTELEREEKRIIDMLSLGDEENNKATIEDLTLKLMEVQRQMKIHGGQM